MPIEMKWKEESPGIATGEYNGWYLTRLSTRGKDHYGNINYDYVALRKEKPFKDGECTRFTGKDLDKIKRAIDLTYEIKLF